MKRATVLMAALTLVAMTTLVLAPAAYAGGETLRGTVITTSGAPAASVWVVVIQGGAEKGRSLSADNGKYYIGNLEPGAYEVQVKRGDTAIYTGSVSLPREGGFDIRLG